MKCNFSFRRFGLISQKDNKYILNFKENIILPWQLSVSCIILKEMEVQPIK